MLAAAAQRKKPLTEWSIGEAELAAFAEKTLVRVVTPGSDAGEPLHLLSALERRSVRWDGDLPAARARGLNQKTLEPRVDSRCAERLDPAARAGLVDAGERGAVP